MYRPEIAEGNARDLAARSSALAVEVRRRIALEVEVGKLRREVAALRRLLQDPYAALRP